MNDDWRKLRNRDWFQIRLNSNSRFDSWTWWQTWWQTWWRTWWRTWWPTWWQNLVFLESHTFYTAVELELHSVSRTELEMGTCNPTYIIKSKKCFQKIQRIRTCSSSKKNFNWNPFQSSRKIFKNHFIFTMTSVVYSLRPKGPMK